MSDNTESKSEPLIAVEAFIRDEEGNLQTVYGPAEETGEARAVAAAMSLISSHDGVIAWVREINSALGEYGERRILFQAGEVPEME